VILADDSREFPAIWPSRDALSGTYCRPRRMQGLPAGLGRYQGRNDPVSQL